MRRILVCAALFLAGCATTPGVDGVACVGKAPAAIAGFVPGRDEDLLARARLPSGKGGVCAAAVFVAQKPVRVYRVYDGSKPWSRDGRWWAFTKPDGPREKYRAEYGICEEWSSLDRLVACDLKPGAEVVAGTTQSVACRVGNYEKTAEIQVFIPNDSQAGQLWVENCSGDGTWP